MSNNKQSSVDWLVEQLGKYNEEMIFLYQNEIQEAKGMHEVQVRRAFYDGQRYEGTKSSMDYYNETFGGNNEQQ